MKSLSKFIFTALLTTAFIIPMNGYAFTKTEAIYSNLKYDGSVNKTIVNNHLKNLNKGDVLDQTYINDIKNVNGYEKFSRDNSNITWKSTGNDIYYQGSVSSSLPIKVSAKYYLNGQEVKPSKIKNKKGNIKIVFDFVNSDYNYDYGMYVPYVVSVTTTVNNKFNSNYSITHGKSISTGEKTVISAISAPGLYESTKIYEFKGLDQITLSYDTTKFEDINFYFVITPKLLSEIDINKLDQINSYLAGINTLQDGVNKLYDGSNQLYNGTVELDNGIDTLSKGLESAADGTNELTNGLEQLNEGVSSFASFGTLIDTLYSKYNENVGLLEQVNGGVNQIDAGISQATSSKDNLEGQLNTVNTGINSLLDKLASTGLSNEEINQLQQLRENKAQLEAGIVQVNETIESLNTQKNSLLESKNKLLGANEGLAQVLCGLIGVSDINYVNEQTIAMFKGKMNTLIGGVNSLYNGSTELNSGLSALYDGSLKLKDGSSKISEGVNTLTQGIDKLNKEGISKLVGISNKANNYINTFKQMSKLSKNYSGYASDNATQTVFIYKLSTSK